jgi:putative aminopeptidase FrvX
MSLVDDIADLCRLVGPSGAEDAVIRHYSQGMRKLGFEPRIDPLGNVITETSRAAGRPHIMVSAHLDEIGFVVRKLEDNGFLRLHRVGGVNDRVIAGLSLTFIADDGTLVDGCVGLKGAHISSDSELKSVVEVDDAYVDVMASSASEVRDMGIDVGSLGTFSPTFTRRGHLVRSKAIDDRVGVALLLEFARRCRAEQPRVGVTLVATIQEEFSVRGGVPAARSVAPELAICLDIAVATDTPDSKHVGDVALGAGAVITRFTRGMANGIIPNPRLLEHAVRVARHHDILHQFGVLQGGLTDASFMQYEAHGIPSIDLSFPTRYSHTPVETCHLNDVEAVADLSHRMITDIPEDFSLARG